MHQVYNSHFFYFAQNNAIFSLPSQPNLYNVIEKDILLGWYFDSGLCNNFRWKFKHILTILES